MSPKFAANFMRVTAIISILSGVLFAMGVIDGANGFLGRFLGIVSSGNEGLDGITSAEAKVMVAIAGGIFTGFSIMLLLIAAPAIEEGDTRIKRSMLIALLAWFAVDSGASIAGGNPVNALSNSVFLALYLLPLLWVSDAGKARVA